MSIELENLASGFSTGIINNNFQRLEEYINNNLLNRDGTELGEANQMELPLDMNSHPVLNASVDPDDPGSLLTREFADSLYVKLLGDTMQGPLHVRKPVFDNEPAQKGQLDVLARSVADIPAIREGDLTKVGDAQVTTSTGTQALTQALDQRVIYVDTVADLLALDTSELVDGQRVSVVDWWGGGLFALTQPYKGGGTFVVTTDVGAEHNGGTIIDPSVPHPDAQVGSTHSERLENYLNGVGATGSGIRYVRLPDGSIGLRPEWFGAKADCIIDNTTLVQGTDDYAAFRKIIDLIEDSQGDEGRGNGLSCIQLAEAGYMIGQTLRTIGNLRILGSANPKHITRGPQAFLTGMPEMDDGIFLLTGFGQRSTGNGAGTSYGFELDHVGFRGYSHDGGNRLPCAVKSIAVGAPARPMNVLSCQLRDFEKALNFDLSERHGTSTGIYNLNITGSVFSYNGFALYGVGPNAIGGLVFKGNVSEQGGRICIEEGAGFGTFDISDNLLEGQSDTIKIGLGRGVVRIGPNYWEGNSGIDIDLDATAVRASSFQIDPQYTLASHTVSVRVGGVGLDTPARRGFDGFAFDIHIDRSSGHINAPGYQEGFLVSGESATKFRGTVGAGIYQWGKKSPLINSGNSSFVTIPEASGMFRSESPAGSMVVQRRLPGEDRTYSLVGVPISAGDVAVLCLWVFAQSETGGGLVSLDRYLFDQDFSSLSSELFAVTLAPGWNAVMVVVEPSRTATDHRWRIANNSNSASDVYLGSAFAYVLPKEQDGVPTRFPWAHPKTPLEEIS